MESTSWQLTRRVRVSGPGYLHGWPLTTGDSFGHTEGWGSSPSLLAVQAQEIANEAQGVVYAEKAFIACILVECNQRKWSWSVWLRLDPTSEEWAWCGHMGQVNVGTKYPLNVQNPWQNCWISALPETPSRMKLVLRFSVYCLDEKWSIDVKRDKRYIWIGNS